MGLLGPNGAGKTTCFRMTCGMIEPNAGKVTLRGIDVTHWPMYRRAREGGMGYLAHESSVFRKLTVEQNLLGEPFTGIDPVTIDSIQAIIRGLRAAGIAMGGHRLPKRSLPRKKSAKERPPPESKGHGESPCDPHGQIGVRPAEGA